MRFSGEAWICLGEILAEQNSLTIAEENIHKGIELCRQAVNPLAEIAGYLALAQVACARGDAPTARRELDRADEMAQRSGRGYLNPLVAAYRAWLSLATQDLPAAGVWAAELLEQRARHADVPRLIGEREDLLLAQVRLAQGRLAEADAILSNVVAAAQSAGRIGAVIEARVLQAVIFNAQGEHAQAERVLCQALALAESEGYARAFVDQGPACAALLRRIERSPVGDPVKAHAERLLTHFPFATPAGDLPIAPASILPSIEPLTARELEVLQLIADGASNQAIADQLVLSIGTVKGHTNHILSKMGVRNRTEAAARAREWGLLET